MPTYAPDVQREYEAELLKHIRKEAFDVKHCFTQYSFQALALITAILGLTLKFYDDNDYVGLVGIPLTLLLVAIASIGTHKYSTANRLLGYELHLQRAARYSKPVVPGWNDDTRTLGWEEAMRAWRIFQATVFAYLYVHGDLGGYDPRPSWGRRMQDKFRRIVAFWRVERLHETLRRSDGSLVEAPRERWFETRSHLGQGMAYHPGGYLQTMLNLIYVTAVLCLLMALHVGFRLDAKCERAEASVVFIGVGLFSYWVLARFMHCYARRKLLEEGLLSINSCAVLWQVIGCAHFSALKQMGAQTDGVFRSYQAYSLHLGRLAVDFCDHIFDLYGWYERHTPHDIAHLVRDPAGPAPPPAAL